VIEVALLLSLGASLPEPPAEAVGHSIVGPSRRRGPPRCDDGSPLRHPDGSPNWDCELRGCSPHEAVCWSDRLDYCYDESGDDAKICAWGKLQTCNSRWTCFDLWTGCDGKYECNEEDSWIGCTDGTCTPKPGISGQSAAHSDQILDQISAPPVSETIDACPLEFRAIERGVTTTPQRLPDFGAGDTVGGHGDD